MSKRPKPGDWIKWTSVAAEDFNFVNLDEPIDAKPKAKDDPLRGGHTHYYFYDDPEPGAWSQAYQDARKRAQKDARSYGPRSENYKPGSFATRKLGYCLAAQDWIKARYNRRLELSEIKRELEKLGAFPSREEGPQKCP